MLSSVNSGKFENADRGISKIKNGNNERFVKILLSIIILNIHYGQFGKSLLTTY